MLEAVRPTILFDLDGPILDVSERHYRLHADFVAARGLPPLPKDDYWARKRRAQPEGVIVSGLEGSRIWTQDYLDFRREHIEATDYLALDRPWPGIADSISEVRSRAAVLLVTLRRSREALLRQLEQLKLADRFDRILSGAPGPNQSREGVKVALIREALGDQCLKGWFIGDTETDIRTAATLGLPAAAVTFGIRDPARLGELNPQLIVESPPALCEWLRSV